MPDLASTYKQKLAEIRNQYPILHRFGDAWALSIYQQIQEGQLNEFVLTTVPSKKTMETLKKRFPKFESAQTMYDEVMIGLDADNIWEVEDLIKFMDGYGWYPAVIDEGKFTQDNLDKTIVAIAKDKSYTTTITFEKKFDDKVELEPYYYHITSDVYADEIERIGLVPKSHSKLTAHPGRVYLLNPTSPSNIKGVAAALFNESKPEIQEKTNYIIVYRVDTDKVNNLEVYEDPNFLIADGAVWTYKNIPPAALERFLEIDIE